MPRWIKRPIGYVYAAAFLNFVVFAIVAVWLGGDAVNGKVADGRYFLGAHGRFTEVSEGVFRYSRLHEASAIITLPPMILVGAIYDLVRRFRSKRGAAL